MQSVTKTIGNDQCRITVNDGSDVLWSYQVLASGATIQIGCPVFEVDGQPCPAVLADIAPSTPAATLNNGCTEYRFTGEFVTQPDLSLEMVFRLADGDPVVRFRYVVHSRAGHALTKSQGTDRLTYLALSAANFPLVKEVRLSEFNELLHSYCPAEYPLEARHFLHDERVMGPLLVAEAVGHTMLVGYEHGSQVPDAFLHYRLLPNRAICLQAVKGNYYHGQPLAPDSPYETVWLQFAAIDGDEPALAAAYRRFVLQHQSTNLASRKPYIFYNTWAFQERNKWWNGRAYLDSMTQERMLQEIEVAHRLGVEVFVLDTGWYEKTGDWRVNTRRFPDGLATIKARLDAYGMKLGLWFSPTEAAVTSTMLRNHEDCIMSRDGKPSQPHPVWETEDSQCLCLVSRYRDAFADELIRLVKEVGVTYFKWDAIGQYGCNDPGHQHGTEQNSAGERADCYAFRLGLEMTHIVDRVCQACPEAIVDFDVTEGGRCVGLGFLAAGKYFLINNGPYYWNYNVPKSKDEWSNIFVYPGPARAAVCRGPLAFDKWIPSVLFLTHYLPDDPAASQVINIASLILGQNGIWGDLLGISEEGVARFGDLLGLYKQVRDDITASSPVRAGAPGSSPEIHEKVSAAGRGVVVIFASARGTYHYVTANRVAADIRHTEGVTVTPTPTGLARIEATFDKPGAAMVFFGV